MHSLPVFVIAPHGSPLDDFLSTFEGEKPRVMDSWKGVREGEEADWGILILGPGVPAKEILEILEHQARENPPWVVLLVREEEGRWVLRTLSLGPVLTPGSAMEIAQDPDGKGPILDLHWALRVVARARHDLNNPLTSGLAEAQLLLMDDHPAEVRESLEIIQDQFRRLRDMVADLSRLRPPRPESSPLG